jgi:hypothetical protein
MSTSDNVYRRFIEFEERAAAIYLQLASHFTANPALSAFWLDMGIQEKQHAGLLQFCLAEGLFSAKLPGAVEIRQVGGLFRNLEKRAAAKELDVNQAFEIAIELESSEVNAIYCHLTASTHGSMYLLRRKIATLAPDHVGHLIQGARKFGVEAGILKKIESLKKSCS